ncbi:MAG TPA: glycosyltransferase family 2 protein [Solirubrobacteraceae bacterium]|jgi:GT2 family glycosyltransferase|nr:glycosyltransferase family 2 protein [Solirubrobacteraceae bacterium]
MTTVCAIVVTHNRKEMLRRCLAALASQRRQPDRILVVDNASTDGTRAMIEHEYAGADLLTLPSNEGSSGGFHEGLKRAHADGAEWMWLMDDDTIPEPDALAELLDAPGRLSADAPPTLLASKVVWRDGRVHPMNFPTPERSRMERVIDGAERGLLPLRSATWVSLLVHRGAVDRHGLPLKHFFIWSDDIEYTSRMVLSGDLSYLVPTSVALHDTEAPHGPESAPPGRFYYHVRNTVFMIRGPARPGRDKLLRVWVLVSSTVAYLVRNPSAASAAAVIRGLRDGLGRPPDA